MKIALILPAYNEALTIKDTIQSFHEFLPKTASIFVVDNNSSDTTQAIASNILNTLDRETGLLFESAQGKGNAIRTAFTQIDAEIYIMADADMTYPADMLDTLLKPVLDGSVDMVVGDRHSLGDYEVENKRPLHNFGNTLVKRLINKLFGSNLQDIMSGYRVMSKKFVKNYPILVSGFQLETDMTLFALDKRFKVKEIPISFTDRPEGSFSKLNTFSDGMKVLLTIFNIFRHYKPLRFFFIVAILFSVVGIIVGIPVISDYLQYKYVYHVPSAILASGLEVLALLSFMVGIILDSMAQKDRINFELRLMDFVKKG